MTAPKNNKRGRAALVVVLCLLALCLAAGVELPGVVQRLVRVDVYPREGGTVLLGGQRELKSAGRILAGDSALRSPDLFQHPVQRRRPGGCGGDGVAEIEVRPGLDGLDFAAAPLAGLVLPNWSMGSYISQTQLASLLGVELSAVEMQDMTNLTLGLGALQKVTPAGALDGYTYYQLPTGETDLTCIVGLPLKELFSGTTPLHILLTIPEHEVRISLSGTVTAAETAVVAPTSRMSDADVDNFVQLRQALEKFAEVLQKAAS